MSEWSGRHLSIEARAKHKAIAESAASPSEPRITNSLNEGESWKGVQVECVAYCGESKDCSNRYEISDCEVVNH